MSPGNTSAPHADGTGHTETYRPPTGTSQPVTRALVLALRERQRVQLKIAGSSMSPFLRHGDLVTVEPVPSGTLGIGKIAAIVRDDRWMMIHRIIARRPDGYLTRGDLAPRADGIIARNDILGTLSEAFRGPRRLRLGLGNEGRILALLSRAGWLSPCLSLAHRLARHTLPSS